MTQRVALYVDPSCPWAWLTSRWLLEVARVRPISLQHKFFSLAEVNRGREEGRAKEAHAASMAALRVMALARRRHGDDAALRLYTALGEARHERGDQLGEVPVVHAALKQAGLDSGLHSEALADPETEREVLAEHQAVAERFRAFGVPTIVLEDGEGQAMFGPIVRTVPRGEAAGELWDHVSWLMRQGDFYELKRERSGNPDIGRLRAEAAAATTKTG
jgi:predicted DsbA family dithiol-disulfide isomerase